MEIYIQAFRHFGIQFTWISQFFACLDRRRGGWGYMGIGGAVSACLCVLSPSRFMASEANMATHSAANMAYLLRTKEGSLMAKVIN